MVVGGGGGVKSFSCKTQTLVRLGYVRLWLGWGFDKKCSVMKPKSQNGAFQIFSEF